MKKPASPFELLIYWITERHHIYQLRFEQKMPKPWTEDPILQSYRFCNVYREKDTVTQWIAQNWRFPYRDDPDLWFAMVVARLFNRPETLEAIGYPVPYLPKRMEAILRKRVADGDKVFSAAYIVSTNGIAKDKISYVLQDVLAPLWAARGTLRPSRLDTLDAYLQRLIHYNGMGRFIAAQVIADLKYVPPLSNARDWWSFAASGPGSRRGMNRVLGRDPRTPWAEVDWRTELYMLRQRVNPRLAAMEMPGLHAQDLQNCLCEFDKYCRAYYGEGTPKQRYEGAAT